MQLQQKNSLSIDLADMKHQIVKRIGTERSHRYFYYLSRLLTKKLSKNEFDKLCVRLIGKENLSLHNHFIRSILKNACDGKAPPAAYNPHPPAKLALDDSCKQTGYAVFAQSVSVPWSNGVVSPKKIRSCIRDHKLKDRSSLHVSNGTVAYASDLASAAQDSKGRIITENGELAPCDYQRPFQKVQDFAELPTSEREMAVYQPGERLGIDRLIDREDALHKDGVSRFSIHAPLGISFCGSSIGGSRRPMPAAVGFRNNSSCYNYASLAETVSLQKRMEQIALDHGLEGVSIESANILNNGLDLYLKRLITSSVSMVGGQSGNGYTNQVSQKQQIQIKFLNGLLPSNHQYIQNNSGPAEAFQEHISFSSISMLDFKVAMELNPQQLGEDWPLLLEKIRMDQFTEYEL